MFNKLFTGDASSYFTVLFSLLLLVTSGQALADSDTASGLDFIPSILAGEATITGRTAGNTAPDITIPATVSDGVTNYNVTSIGISAFQSNSLASVTIPDSMTSIRLGAFSDNSLTTVSFLGSYSASTFSSFMFISNATLSTIYVCDDTAGWSGISFINGTSSIPVTQIDCSPAVIEETIVIPDGIRPVRLEGQSRITLVAGNTLNLAVSGGEAPYRSVVVGPVNGTLEGNTLSIEALSVGQAYIVISDAYDQADLVSITVIESGFSQLDLIPLTSDNDEINDAGVGGSATAGVTADNGVTFFSNGSFCAGETIKVVMIINPPATYVGELAEI